MSEAFVWFHNSSNKPSDSAKFYESLLGWQRTDGGPKLGLALLENSTIDVDGYPTVTLTCISCEQRCSRSSAASKQRARAYTKPVEQLATAQNQLRLMSESHGSLEALRDLRSFQPLRERVARH